MTCAACVGRIERKLRKLPGVEATVNLATERATVACPDELDPRLLIEQVTAAGFVVRRIDEATAAVADGDAAVDD
ncbi:MAG: heavy-metal-associated domain-containing protein, partial [Pseudonocardia sp.]|nr:heavy-metal-associated domain-containing protein [Pseudonocardia sp.]